MCKASWLSLLLERLLSSSVDPYQFPPFYRNHPEFLEWLRNPGKGTLGSWNPKQFLGEHGPGSLKIHLLVWHLLFQKSVNLCWLYRSVPDNCIKRSALPDPHQLKTSSEDDVFSKPKMRQKCKMKFHYKG